MKMLFIVFIVALYPNYSYCQNDSVVYYSRLADKLELLREQRRKDHGIPVIYSFNDFLLYANLDVFNMVEQLTEKGVKEWRKEYNREQNHYIVLVNNYDSEERINVDIKNNIYYISYQCLNNPKFNESAMNYINEHNCKRTVGESNGNTLIEVYDNIDFGMRENPTIISIRQTDYGYGKIILYQYGISHK